ncbi:hypothetical protein ABT288_06750 [Streptomyces sp. NPDC001093]|uniref:hypothetical protein n=1 Tax=Streptomyces sp. NPDC001093 TaxID=3154376 RepID=UPI0033302979
MQQSAVPELAHAQTRPIHWVATATAVAGVVALSSVVQPGSATAAQTHTDTRGTSVPAAIAPPSTTGVTFPLQCGPVKAVVARKTTGDLDGDGRPETAAVVHCDSAMGTPPDGVYVLTRSPDSDQPRIVATLVDPKDRLTVTDFSIRAGTVTATLLGYSSDAVPNCCPDVRTPAKWHWNGTAFIRSTPTDTHGV